MTRRLSILVTALGLSACTALQAQTVAPLSATARSNGGHPEAIQLQGQEYVVPELIVGGEWNTTIKLTNRGTVSIPTTNVDFVDDQGFALTASFQTTDGSIITDTGFAFSLPIGTTVEGTFVGGRNTNFGHAIIRCNAAGCGTPGLYGEVILRNRNSTRPDFESVFSLEQPAPVQYMLFDGRNLYTTTLYLVNNRSTSNTMFIDIFDTGNHLVRTVRIPFGGLQSQLLTLHVVAPETIGISGTLVISGANDSTLFTATALRINPSNSFTPIRAWVPKPQ